MLSDDLRALCVTHVEGNGVALQRVNAKFDPSDQAIWARFAHIPGQSATVQYGKTKTARRPGILLISLHVPVNSGEGLIKAKAGLIINAFSYLRQTGLRFDSAYEQPGLYDEDWYMLNVACPFDNDTQHGS